MMKQIFGIIILIGTLQLCSAEPVKAANNNDSICNWVTYQDTVEFNITMTLKYPDNLIFAKIVDNCRCIGKKINYKNIEDPDPPVDSLNTRQWSICILDTAEHPVEYYVNSWKTIFKGQITEKRDSIFISNTKALRVILKSNNKDDSYRQLIYFKKYSTLFEIMNIYENTNKDFAKFCKFLTIKEKK